MIRILIAEDMHMLRRALASLLQMEADLDVVAEVACGDQIVPRALEARPDVAVLDIALPGIDGITAAARLHEKLPCCRTLILTSIGRPGHLRRALSAHAAGLMLKDAEPGQLVQAIRAVAAGERVVDQQLALAAIEGEETPLTMREMQVFRLAAVGHDVQQIAATLSLSTGTVRNYLTTVVAKLNARNRVDAVRIAQDAGWL